MEDTENKFRAGVLLSFLSSYQGKIYIYLGVSLSQVRMTDKQEKRTPQIFIQNSNEPRFLWSLQKQFGCYKHLLKYVMCISNVYLSRMNIDEFMPFGKTCLIMLLPSSCQVRGGLRRSQSVSLKHVPLTAIHLTVAATETT